MGLNGRLRAYPQGELRVRLPILLGDVEEGQRGDGAK